MKNLKRVLSLGLASVMLMGMMVVGASAKDFTDAEDIVHNEAVQTLVALNVVAGKEDGSYFDPKGDVTRGEMAKMITVVMQGGSEVNTGVKATPSFTDIGGHWAEPYIEYCYDLNIISGRGDGTFDPNGKVTGLEAAKMVLTALGYDAEAYKLTGASWATRTDEVARTSKGQSLYENLGSVTMSQPASRDTAAQLIWNGLQAFTVTMAPGQNKNNGEVTWNFNTDSEITLLNQRYKANVMLATYEGNHDYKLTGSGINPEKGEIGVTAKKGVNLGKGNEIVSKGDKFTFPSDMSIDNIGEEVKIVWKNGEKSTVEGPDSKDTIYGVFNTGATRVVRSQLSKVKDNKTTKAILNIDGTKYDTVDRDADNKNDLTVEVVTNYSKSASYRANNGVEENVAKNIKGQNSTLVSKLKFNSGDKIKVVFNDDGLVNRVYVTQSYVAAVTGVNSTTVTLNNGIGALKFEDHDIAEGLEKGDVVLVTPLYGEKLADCTMTVEKAEKVSGEVTSYKINDDTKAAPEDENVVVGGKTYKINYKNIDDAGVSFKHSTAIKLGLLEDIPNEDNVILSFYDKNNKDQDTYIGEDVDLYLSNGYVVAAVQTSESANNYSVITEVKEATAGGTFNALQLQVMGVDGTKEIITVSKESVKNDKHPTHNGSTGAITQDDYHVGDIITYTFDDDDNAEVTVKGLVVSSNFSYNEKTKTVSVGGKSYPTSGDCVLFAQTESQSKKVDGSVVSDWNVYNKVKMPNAEWDAYDIRALDDMEKAGTYATVALNSDKDKAMAVFVNYNETPDGASDDTVYGIVSSYNGRKADYYMYTVQANGEEYEVNYKGDNSKSLQKGDLVKFDPTADNNYKATKIVKANGSDDFQLKAAYVKEHSNRDNTLTVYFGVQENKKDEIFEGKGDTTTYTLDKDVKIIYVDKDGSTSTAESSISEFSSINGKANVAFKTKTENSGKWNETEVITVLFVETSGKVDILK